MKTIVAPNNIDGAQRPTVFLAGGITNCPWWQDRVVEVLADGTPGTLLNPRRRNFPIDDPSAAQKQIRWEYYALAGADIFSMWFAASESVQPICMYELGRHLAIRYRWGQLRRVVIGIAPGYRREQDVRIQVALVASRVAERIADSLDGHIENIRRAAKAVHEKTEALGTTAAEAQRRER